MIQDNPYQNQDLESQNPIRVTMEDTTPSDSTTPIKKSKFSLPQDPKMKLLYILVALIIVLFAISLIVTAVRSISTTPKRITVTPTPAVTPLPTEVADIKKIPDELKVKFDQVDKESQININFSPPQIDAEIGM